MRKTSTTEPTMLPIIAAVSVPLVGSTFDLAGVVIFVESSGAVALDVEDVIVTVTSDAFEDKGLYIISLFVPLKRKEDIGRR